VARSGTMLQPHELWVEKTNAPKSEMSGMKRNGRLKDSSCVGWRCGVNEGMQLCGMTERTRQKTQGSDHKNCDSPISPQRPAGEHNNKWRLPPV